MIFIVGKDEPEGAYVARKSVYLKQFAAGEKLYCLLSSDFCILKGPIAQLVRAHA